MTSHASEIRDQPWTARNLAHLFDPDAKNLHAYSRALVKMIIEISRSRRFANFIWGGSNKIRPADGVTLKQKDRQAAAVAVVATMTMTMRRTTQVPSASKSTKPIFYNPHCKWVKQRKWQKGVENQPTEGAHKDVKCERSVCKMKSI